MAPSLEEPVSEHHLTNDNVGYKSRGLIPKVTYVPGRTNIESHDAYEHEDLRPNFPDFQWPPLEPVPYTDKALDENPEFRNLLESATDIFDYTPKIGTEIHGISLSRLTDAQKNDLAVS
jgi:sulfonate dioxygenase